MRWQWVARIVVAVIGLGCAAAIFVYTRSREQDRPKPADPPPTLANIDPKSALDAGAGTTMVIRAGRSPIKISFDATRTYDDGRTRWDNATVEGLEESHFTVRADVLEARAKTAGDRPDRFDLTGHVVISTDDGLRLETDKALYDDAAGTLAIPGPVSFSKGRLIGHAVGAAYDRTNDTIALLDQAAARVQADAAGHGSADATSTRMNLARGQHTVRLEGNARIVGDTQTVTADTATLSFTEDESALKYMELRGNGRVTPNAGAAAGQPALGADNVTMAFQPDGLTLQHATLTGHGKLALAGATARSVSASWIDLVAAADGRTLTDLQARDQVVVDIAATPTSPGRTIKAASLVAKGDDKKGLTTARFEGNPRFDELPAQGPAAGAAGAPARARWGTATVLVLALGGQIDAIESAEFQQRAQFHDGDDVVGVADVVKYDEAKAQLHLIPNSRQPRQRSNVTTADMRVDGWTIDVDTGSQDLRAQGSVTTTSKNAAGGTEKSQSALFGGTGPVNGAAETLAYTKSTGIATYTGSASAQARLWQGDSKVAADLIEFVDASRKLDARGKVESVWNFEAPAAGAPAATAPTPAPAKPAAPALKRYRVLAETLHYDESRRMAIYTGAPVSLTTLDGDVESPALTFVLASASSALQEMRAEGGVEATLSGGYEAVGERLVYHAETEIYTLYGKAGKLAQVKAPPNKSDQAAGAATMCTRTDGLELELNERARTVVEPGESQAPRTTTQILCTTSLRRGK